MPISILMSKIIFKKHLPFVRPKLVPKLKKIKIYWSLVHLIFQICRSWFWRQKYFLLNIYQLLCPNWSQNKKMLRIYWNLAEVTFQKCRSQFRCPKSFLLSIYYLLGPNWSKIKSVQNLLKFDTFNISIMPISI